MYSSLLLFLSDCIPCDLYSELDYACIAFCAVGFFGVRLILSSNKYN